MKTTTRISKARKKRSGAKRASGPSIGQLAIESLTQAVAFEAGENNGVTARKVTARKGTAEPPPAIEASQIAELRQKLGLSQPVFANALNVSPGAVKSWEQGMNPPSGAALRLLEIATVHPELILEFVEAR